MTLFGEPKVYCHIIRLDSSKLAPIWEFQNRSVILSENHCKSSIHWSPHWTFCPRKIDHKSGLTLYPGYWQYQDFKIGNRQKLTFRPKRTLIRGPLQVGRVERRRGKGTQSQRRKVSGVCLIPLSVPTSLRGSTLLSKSRGSNHRLVPPLLL